MYKQQQMQENYKRTLVQKIGLQGEQKGVINLSRLAKVQLIIDHVQKKMMLMVK